MRLILFLLALGYVQSQDTITYDDSNRRVITKVPGDLGGDYVNGAFAQSRFWQPQGGMLIAGSNVMVMADTGNQVIRKVDWGAKTTSLVIGNATVTGNCLDNTCPANSFSDGTGAAATLTMPYSVKMHHQMRYVACVHIHAGSYHPPYIFPFSFHTDPLSHTDPPPTHPDTRLLLTPGAMPSAS